MNPGRFSHGAGLVWEYRRKAPSQPGRELAGHLST